MKNLLIWYLPQAALFCFGFWWAMQMDPPTTGLAMVVFGVMLAAAYTGGVNLLMSVSARLRRHRTQAATQGDSLAAGGRLASERPQQRQRIGVDQDFR